MRIFVTANTFAPNRVGFSSTFNTPPESRQVRHRTRSHSPHACECRQREVDYDKRSHCSTSIYALSYTVRERRVLAGPANTCSLQPPYTCLYERIGWRDFHLPSCSIVVISVVDLDLRLKPRDPEVSIR